MCDGFFLLKRTEVKWPPKNRRSANPIKITTGINPSIWLDVMGSPGRKILMIKPLYDTKDVKKSKDVILKLLR